MYVYIKQPGIVCLLCWFCLSCTLQRTEHPTLRQAGYLMEEHADSAFSLLKSISSLIGMTPEDKADYALLLAEAADKNGYSLLPCDSLLNLALHVYHEEAKEHAIALLYKGKVQQEMENYADALKSYRMALEILSAYPCEFYWKGFVYNMLGGLYGKQNLYAQAKDMYVKACYNDSLARHNRHFISSLSNLGVAYIGYGNIDSAFICQQRALQLSLSTDSFLLHSLYGNIGDLCGRTGRTSIAITCLKRAYDACRLREDSLQCLWNLGEFYYNNGQLDSALYYLNRSKEAVDIHIRYLSFFDLYAIAKQQGNVEKALEYLEISTELEDSIYSTNVATELEKKTYRWNADAQVRKEQFKAKRRIYTIAMIAVVLLLVIVIIYQQILKNKKIQQSNYKYLLQKLKQNLMDMQQNIAQHEEVIAELKQFKAKRRIYTIAMIVVVLLLVIVIIYQQILKNKKIQQSNYKYLLQKLKQNLMDMQQNIAQHEEVIAELKQKQESRAEEIEEKERAIEAMKMEKEKLRNWLFRQSALYTKIDKLANQQKHHKERIAVLTNAEQRQLRVIIGQIYADYIEQLHTRYPKLNEDDVLLLCLQLADLSPFAIALCFGNNDAQIVAQRKYRMKSKME